MSSKSKDSQASGMITDEWSRVQYHVITELDRLSGEVGHIKNKLDIIHVDLAALKATSRLWGGLVGGAVGAIVAFGSAYLGRS